MVYTQTESLLKNETHKILWDSRVKIKENEKRDTYLALARELFLKREMAPKSYGFIRGCPLAGNNNETFCIYTGAFWVLTVRLSLESWLGRNKEQRTAILPAGPS